jgi:hypothetical protein
MYIIYTENPSLDKKIRPFLMTISGRYSVQHHSTKPFFLPQYYQNLEIPSKVQPTTGTTSISDLSAEGRSNFQLALSFYKAQKDHYDGERDALDKLQTWMTITVASSYAKTCLNYSEGIKEWYEKLKEQASMNEYSIKREIKASYRQAVRPL